jgi:hypothetical protein
MLLLTVFKYACFSNCVPTYTRGVYLRFDDLREAAEGKHILEQHNISGYQYARAKSQDTAQLNEFEGQISLTVVIDANPEHAVWEYTQADQCVMIVAIDNICQAFGPVRGYHHVATNSANMTMTFRIEFFSVDAANRSVCSLNIDPVWGTNAEVSYPLLPCLATVLTCSQKSFQWVTNIAAHWTGDRAANSPHRTQPRVDDQGRFVGYRAAVDPNPRPTFYRHPADQHNRVRRERIQDGSDVRTTVMLRNIPNKMDWVRHVSPSS